MNAGKLQRVVKNVSTYAPTQLLLFIISTDIKLLIVIVIGRI